MTAAPMIVEVMLSRSSWPGDNDTAYLAYHAELVTVGAAAYVNIARQRGSRKLILQGPDGHVTAAMMLA